MDETQRYKHMPLPVCLAQSLLPTATPGPVLVRGSDVEGAPTRHMYVTRRVLEELPPQGLRSGDWVRATSYAWTRIASKREAQATLKLFVWSLEI